MIDYDRLHKFPCGKDKAPLTRWGGKDREPYERTLYERRWWPLVAVETGDQFDVLDVDPQGVEWLQANAHRIPDTRVHQTRRGGLHLFFRAWPYLRCSAGKIAPGVDVRASGGYIIWWPREGGPVEHPGLLADWPSWLVDLALQTNNLLATSPLEVRDWAETVRDHKVTAMRHSKEETYAMYALGKSRRRIAQAPVGQREATLNSNAFSIGRLAGAGRISPGKCAAMLVAGVHENAATDEHGRTFYQEHGREWIVQKVRRALLAGMAKPAVTVPGR
jgi:hypothetical protein